MPSVTSLTCPSCSSPIPKERVRANKPFECSTCGTTLLLTDWTRDGHIICDNCGTINDRVVAHCVQCGQGLRAGCPYCYESNSIGATQCTNCGANLQQAWERQRSFLTTTEQQAAERRAALQQAADQEKAERLQRLLKQLDEPENHPLAIYGLNNFGPDAIEPLINLLKNDDPDARYGAAHALGKIGDQRAAPNLIAALDDPDPAVRYWAADALGKLKAAAAIQPIGKLLRDKHRGVKKHAAWALEQIGTPQARKTLRRRSGWWPFG